MITFNYWCLEPFCKQTKMIKVNKQESLAKRKEFCMTCSKELKLVGRSTMISHINTQESNNIKH